MLEKLEEYVIPKTVAEAVRLLRRDRKGKTVAITGAIDVHWPRLQNARRFVDTSRLGLRYIRETKTTLKIGAATPLEDIVQSKVCARFAGGLLRQGALGIASPPRRCEITAAALVINAVPWCDLVPALMALDAKVVVRGAKRRSITVAEFFAGKGRADVDRELVVEITVPKPKARTGFALERTGLVPSDDPILMTAVTLKASRGKVERATIAIGGGVRLPVRVDAMEEEIRGKPVDMGVFECIAWGVAEAIDPINDVRASAEHRREVCKAIVRRALARAAGLEASR